jgi:hypothetical protein
MEVIDSVKLPEVDHLLAVVAAIIARLLEVGESDRATDQEQDNVKARSRR